METERIVHNVREFYNIYDISGGTTGDVQKCGRFFALSG